MYFIKKMTCFFKKKYKDDDFINAIIEQRLSYLSPDALKELMSSVRETNELEGDIIETGCALGGSAICIGKAKKPEKHFYVYDVFGMIPEPGENDGNDVHERYKEIKDGNSKGIGGDIYYGYRDNLKGFVEDKIKKNLKIRHLKNQNISLIQGLFEQTLSCCKVCFAHIDCDWYDSVRVCLERIEPYLGHLAKLNQ